jgi:inhibitor of KinA sporulation pathway (predicted exonuclease)
MSTVFQAILPSRKGGGLTSQMSKVGLQFEGRQHNALTDAINTVRLLQVYLDGMRIWYKADSLISNRKKGDSK